tara:strand:+ start:249 stop:584 length:336 start_codon:yes stop_codon:yes gene_type:complete
MDPIARKLNVHTEAFTKAFENGNADDAKQHLEELLKFGGFLHEDLTTKLTKADNPMGEFVNGVPVLKFNERGTKFNVNQRSDQLAGTIISARSNSRMRPHTGTFGSAYRPE